MADKDYGKIGVTKDGVHWFVFSDKGVAPSEDFELCGGKDVKEWIHDILMHNKFGSGNIAYYGYYCVGGVRYRLDSYLKRYLVHWDDDHERVYYMYYATNKTALRQALRLPQRTKVFAAPQSMYD